jgi:NAD(P)H-flavin reductase
MSINMTATVCGYRPLDAGIFALEVEWAGPAPRPGQFFMVRPLRTSCFLGRPISVAGFADGRITFLIARVGRGTRELATLRPGEEVELTGPLGNSFLDFLPGIAHGTPPALAIIGGGIGVAPLLLLSRQCRAQGIDATFLAGYKTASGLEQMLPADAELFTEDGSSGTRPATRGFATSGFCAVDYDGVFACGPLPMLKAVARLCAADTTPCFVSMERRMACGVGACLGCTIPTRGPDGATVNRRCCADGPVFTATEVLFE